MLRSFGVSAVLSRSEYSRKSVSVSGSGEFDFVSYVIDVYVRTLDVCVEEIGKDTFGN